MKKIIQTITNFLSTSRWTRIVILSSVTLILTIQLVVKSYKGINSEGNSIESFPIDSKRLDVFRMSEIPRNVADIASVRHYALSGTNFILDHYAPSNVIFSELKEECPWRSASFVEDMPADPRRIQGEPIEAFGLVNPLLLISPLFVTNEKSTASTHKTFILPIQPQIKEFIFDADKEELSVTFDVSAFRVTTGFSPDSKIMFRADSFNALDLGYHTLRLTPESNLNIKTSEPVLNSYANISVFGCFPEIDPQSSPTNRLFISPGFPLISIESLPAIATFDLWKDSLAKESIPDRPEDIRFVVKFI